MNSVEVDVNEIAGIHKKVIASVSGIPGAKYFSYLKYILAMKKLGWQNDLICEWLNSLPKIKENQSNTIKPKNLSYFLCLWKQRNLINIDENEINTIASKIENPNPVIEFDFDKESIVFEKTEKVNKLLDIVIGLVKELEELKAEIENEFRNGE